MYLSVASNTIVRMPRPAQFDQDSILDAALRSVTGQSGLPSLSVEAIAQEMGGNVGSIYYRFPSKDHLLAQLWIRCARRGQTGMIAALSRGDLDSALADAALHYPRWARSDQPAAQMLAAYGREQLIPRWPDELANELETMNQGLVEAVRRFTKRRFGDTRRQNRQATTFALLDMPAAAIRRYLLAGQPPPPSLDAVILAAARAALDARLPNAPRSSPPA
jgi:AcrR family transcriptional regulator